MIQSLGIIVAVTLIIAQVILGFVAHAMAFRLKHKYGYRLESGSTSLDLLESYITVYESVNVKVNAPIHQPALFYSDVLMLNRDKAQRSNIYNITITAIQLVLGRDENEYMRKYVITQMFLWFCQLLTLYLAIRSDILWLVPCIILAIVNIVYSVFLYIVYGEIVLEALDVIFIILDLTDEERQIALQLGQTLRGEVFKYGFTPIWLLYRFIIPMRS